MSAAEQIQELIKEKLDPVHFVSNTKLFSFS